MRAEKYRAAGHPETDWFSPLVHGVLELLAYAKPAITGATFVTFPDSRKPKMVLQRVLARG